MENAIDWSLVPDGTINCNNIDRYLRIVNGRIVTPPEEKIDIFTLTDKFIPDWNSKVTLQKYEDLSKVYLDIETTRINRDWSTEENAKNGRLIMIGVRNERGKNIIIRDDSEVNMLQELSRILNKKKPDVILTFNGLRYDLPYLHAKYQQYALNSPFWIYDNAPLRYGMARIAGRPWDAEYRPVYCKFGGKKCAHVDVYYLAVCFDAVMRRFTKFTLKSLPIQMGLRSEERLDLGIEGIEKCIAERDWSTLGEYLAYDLEDTEILANVFMPSTYYQLKYFPKYNLQSVAMAGNASKWNSILSLHYGAEYVDKLPDPIISCFQGAITFAKAGVFKDVVSFDFSGQYPSSMMAYGICSKHDPDNLMLAVVKSAVDYRNSIKYKEDKTKADDDLATAVKPVINSCFKGTTLVLTDKGVFPIIDLVGKKVKVLNKNRKWVDVEFKSYGEQELCKVTLRRKRETEVIYCTPNHEWEVQQFNSYYVSEKRNPNKEFDLLKNTDELKTGKYGDLIPNITSFKPDTNNDDYHTGVIHGIVYGDGQKKLSSGKPVNYNIEKGQCYVTTLIGNKKELEKYFKNSERVIKTAAWDEYDQKYIEPNLRHIRVYSHIQLKDLPDLSNSNSYLLGFFRGLLATDGTISDLKNSVPAFTMQKHVCDYLNKIAPRIGFKSFEPYLVVEKDTKVVFKNSHDAKTNYDYYRINFQIEQFEVKDFLISFHRVNYRIKKSQLAFTTSSPWRVESVESTGMIETVYCCVEPKTHTFTLANGVLTRNCYGSLAAFIPFGDSIAAAKVTLFARARLKWSKAFVERIGGEVVLSDTDSLYIRTTRMDAHLEFPISEKNMALMPPDASPQMLSAYAVGLELERNIPEGSKLDFDGCYKVLFVPPTETPDKFDKTYKFCTPKGRKFVSEVLSDEKFVDEYISSNYYDENITYSTLQEISDKFDLGFPQYQAVKKNYIKIVWDIKKQEWKTKAKGRYGKRDVSKLEKEFQQKYIEKYAVCPDDAKKYYEDLRKEIMSGEYDTNNLMTVRKIRHGEVTLVNLGFGRPGDEVKFYQGYGHPTNTEKYNKYHYTKLIEELYLEIACFLGMTPTAPKSQQFKQLKLFDIA